MIARLDARAARRHNAVVDVDSPTNVVSLVIVKDDVDFNFSFLLAVVDCGGGGERTVGDDDDEIETID